MIKIYDIQFNVTRSIIQLFVFFFILSFSGCEPTSSGSGKTELSDVTDLNRQIHISVGRNQYQLELVSSILIDTLSGKWKDELYGSPIVLSQYLSFKQEGVEVRRINGPEKTTRKSTLGSGYVNSQDLVLFDVCVGIKSEEVFFKVEGSGFCHGVSCPEYYGIFNQSGEPVYENGPALKDKSNEREVSADLLIAVKAISYSECESLLNYRK